jgi:hypothetical protein
MSVGITLMDALITYVAAHKDSDIDPIKMLEQDLWAICLKLRSNSARKAAQVTRIIHAGNVGRTEASRAELVMVFRLFSVVVWSEKGSGGPNGRWRGPKSGTPSTA